MKDFFTHWNKKCFSLVTLELGFDLGHSPPNTAAMFQRHCTSLDAVRCFLDLLSVLRSLPQITAVRQQMERQDNSEQNYFGILPDILNLAFNFIYRPCKSIISHVWLCNTQII